MSDFESRVRDALGAGASGAPDATGLADAARGRARTRRRMTMVVSAVAVLAVVAVPVGVLALRDSGDASSGPGIAKDVTDPPASAVPDGWRTETWRDLEIEVPDDWGYGALSTWCIGHDEPGYPVVERPGGAVPSIGCGRPDGGLGAQFFDPAAYDPAYAPGQVRRIREEPGRMPFPFGSWVGYTGANGDAAVLVVARDEETAQRILDSARRVDGVDSNGCPPKDGDAVPSGGSIDDEGVSVCRYDADGWLVQSELLSRADTAAAMAALAAAPIRQEQEPCGLSPDRYGAVVIGTRGDLGSVRVVWQSTCPGGRGVFFSGVVRELTADVMYWALSPGWSGGVDGDVPLPAELRR